MIVTLNLNMKLLPFMRTAYENRIDKEIKKAKIGEVTGGGTDLEENGEVRSCDIEIKLRNKKHYDQLLEILKKIKMARSSKVISEKEIIEIGEDEGLAIYLNGTDLPKEVYETCDVNYVFDKLTEAMDGIGLPVSHFEGDKETALYFYGKSFEAMKDAITDFTSSYPLCEKCRIVQIA